MEMTITGSPNSKNTIKKMQRSHINDRDVENSIIMHRKQSAVGYAANDQPKYCPVSPE